MTVGKVLVRQGAHGGTADWPLVALVGEIDLANVEQVEHAVQAAVASSALGLVLDLSGVTYLDSTGLRLLYHLARQLHDREQELRLVVPAQSRIRRILELAGVSGVIPVTTAPDRGPSEGANA